MRLKRSKSNIEEGVYVYSSIVVVVGNKRDKQKAWRIVANVFLLYPFAAQQKRFIYWLNNAYMPFSHNIMGHCSVIDTLARGLSPLAKGVNAHIYCNWPFIAVALARASSSSSSISVVEKQMHSRWAQSKRPTPLAVFHGKRRWPWPSNSRLGEKSHKRDAFLTLLCAKQRDFISIITLFYNC